VPLPLNAIVAVAVVRMSELNARSLVFTLDRQFGICRRFKRKPIPLVTPVK
jgi:hypothetical protein